MERRISDPVRLFDGLRNRLNTQSQNFGGGFANPNLLKLKKDTTYKFRLLWVNAAEGCDREFPMINQYVHRIWDENSLGSKDVRVYCRTSQYDKGETREGYETCPICKKMSALYKEYTETGSKSCHEIYNKFRRTVCGYVPVYVISGPVEDVHKIKILQYTKMFKDFFDQKIFGISKRKPNQNNDQNNDVEEETVGIEAFTYYDTKSDSIITKGYDFIVSVGTKRVELNGKKVDLPDYKLDFTRKMSELDFEDEEMTVNRFLNLSDELGFDRDFYKISTDEQLEEFKAKYIGVEQSVNTSSDDNLDLEDEKPKTSSKSEKMNQIINNMKNSKEDVNLDEDLKTEEVKEDLEEEPEEKENTSSNDDDDINIDDLLKDI